MDDIQETYRKMCRLLSQLVVAMMVIDKECHETTGDELAYTFNLAGVCKWIS